MEIPLPPSAPAGEALPHAAHPDRAHALLEIARALARADSEREVAQVAVGLAYEALGARAAAAYFLSAPDTLSLVAARGVERPPEHFPLDLDRPLPTCVRTGQAIFLSTLDELVARFPSTRDETHGLSDEDRQALACLPLFSGKEVVGVLAFTFDRPRAFDDEERTFLLTIKNHAAVAVERARLRKAERAARRRLEVLSQASRRFSEAPPEVGAIAEIVAEEIAGHFGCTCAVSLISREGTTLEPAAFHCPDPELLASARQALLEAPLALTGGSTIAHAARTGRPVFVPEVNLERLMAEAPHQAYREHLARFPVRSIAVMPLKAHEAMLGALTVSTPLEAPALTEEDREMIEDLARRGALALQNARSFEAARRAIRGRDDLLAVVSHDLRNPLATLSLNVETLRRRLREQELPQRTLSSMRRAIDRMEGLIQNLLDLAILDAHKLPLKLQPISAQELLDETVAAHEPLAAERSIALCDERATGDALVECDRERILQVLGNLLGNAIKFTPAGGRVTVGARAEGGAMVFFVADTGPGIAPEQLGLVFDRFWQAGEAGKKGLGLGLSIVKGLVAAHGGRVWAESALGRGSRFFFSLPLERGARR